MTVYLLGYFRPRMLNYSDSLSLYSGVVVLFPLLCVRVLFILLHCYLSFRFPLYQFFKFFQSSQDFAVLFR